MTALLKIKQTTSEIALQGCAMVLDLTGAIFLPEHDVLLVADLHFEKGSSFARRGMMLPPYDTRETLKALCVAVPATIRSLVIALGDSFHDIGGPDRLGDDERATLAQVQQGATGSGSRAITTARFLPSIGGEVVEEMVVGPLTLRHEPVAGRAFGDRRALSSGRQGGDARTLDPPPLLSCVDGSRCIMPALGAYAGG